jgi:site-specific DNA-methyltransferase (adenine-specific)
MMDKMRMESSDLVTNNIEKIEELFPNCITETIDENGKQKKAINFNILKQMLSGDIAEENEAYEFTWAGKKASILEANRSLRKTLRPSPEESVEWDTTQNIYIEGDNLEALKLLQESYLGKIKMIYIDPPYNTGNDFVYMDDFAISTDEYEEATGVYNTEGNKMFKNTDANGRFHSDWCSMMYSRLILARNLLTKDGVMFISIDDNEVENLTKIGKEVFGDSNYINALKWKRKKQPSFLSRHIAPVMEYILIFAKNSNYMGKLSVESVSDLTKKVINISNASTERIFKEGVEVKGITNGIIPKGVYTVKTMSVEYKNDIIVKDCYTINPITVKAKFLNTQDKINEFIDKKLLFITAAKGLRRYISEEEKSKAKSITDLILDWGDNQDSEKEQKELLGEKYFDYTKPVQLIYNLVKSCTSDEDIIMDFFSGSSTTAHSVMKLNAEDGGNRNFIMIQLPEKTDLASEAYKAGYPNICEIGKERIRRAGKKILEDNTDKEEIKDLDIGFRVLKLDDSNMTDVYYNPSEYSQDLLSSLESNVKSDRTDLDLLFGCLLEWGLPLSLPYKSEQIDGCTVHNYNDGDLIACFDENVPENVIKEIAKKQPLRAVFRDSSFVNSPSKINVGEIFKLMAPDTRVKVI